MKIITTILVAVVLSFQAQSQCDINNVSITAILADPSGGGNAYDTNGDGDTNNQADEFVEICNQGMVPVDISGWELGDNDDVWPDLTFPAGTVLAPGACALVVTDWSIDDSQAAPPGVIDLNLTVGWLANTGEVVTLANAAGSASCSVVYNSQVCATVNTSQIPPFDPTTCSSWGNDLDGCVLTAAGVDCNYDLQTLPVQYLSVKAAQRGQSILVEWVTASEVNNERFDIEWSQDGRYFHTVGSQKGRGTTLSLQEYAFTHMDPVAGDNFYRIRQVDFNGSLSFSVIRHARFKARTNVQVYPTVVEDNLFVTGLPGPLTLEIFSISGHLVHIQKEVDNGMIDLSALNPGLYIVRLGDDNRFQSQRIIKK